MDKPQNKKQNQLKQAAVDVSKQVAEALRHVADTIKHAWQRTSYEDKVDYRQFYLASDIPQARVVTLLLAITIALFAISDYMILGFSVTFYALVVLRVVLIACSAYYFRYIGKTTSYHAYDKSTFTYMLIIVVGILLVNLTRPQNFVPHIIVIDMAVFVFYLVMPTRFVYQAIPSLIFSLGEILLVTFTFNWFMEPGLFTALFSLIFTNVVAALGSLQIHSYRWLNYQNFLERKETDRLVAIGQTAGMIGHDIRNPLQAITSELYLAKDALNKSPVSKEIKNSALESVELIEEQTDYISKIVSDLQDYARPLKPEIKEIDLAKLVTSVFQTIRVPSKIELKIDVQGFPKIKTDPTLIRRALTNLVTNAIQAMPDGGKLELTASITEYEAVIVVSDTGKGIPEEIKPKLFTPLVTTKAKGQGLGLAVVKRLVEVLGGSITFESQVDKGTKFIIHLPVKE